MDWVVVRENTEGEYAGIGGRNLAARGPGKAIAIQAGLFTEEGCERIMRYAFDMARAPPQKVTSVTKSNAQQFGMTLWDEVFARVARLLLGDDGDLPVLGVAGAGQARHGWLGCRRRRCAGGPAFRSGGFRVKSGRRG